MDPIPFHVPTLDESDIPGVVEVLRGGWITTGPRCKEFEENFGRYLGQDVHCVAVNSGTAALHLAVEAAGLGPGHKVITTPFTFTASAEVLRYVGADPLFVDVDPDTFNLDAARVRQVYLSLPEAERETVRAILPVHYGGLPCAMDDLEAFAHEFGLALVDDAAHALPTRRQGRLIGTFGDATAFSFYATKPLCTGEGGMVTTRDAALAARMRTMRLHGISRDVFDRYTDANATWYYEVVAPGFKYNMTDITAALGLSQLERIDAFRDRRAQVAAMYDAKLAGLDGVETPPHAPDGDLHAWHLYPLRISDGRAVRDALIEELTADGIGTSVHFIPLHLQPYYRERYGLGPTDFPVATKLFEQELSLPIYPSLTDSQVESVTDRIRPALVRARKRAVGAATR
jgi:dTDP-4-amino-4,6-dideoxygalactose transaminase